MPTLPPEEQAALDALADSYAASAAADEAAEQVERARLEALAPGLGNYVLGDDVTSSPHGIFTRHPADVASYIGGEVEPPEMLIDGWLVKGVLHWLHSDAETGKTWLALKLARWVLYRGEKVVYSDEELGLAEIVSRLTTLGATPEECTRLVYLPFQSASMKEDDRHAWYELLRIVKPALVIFDTATDHLVAADLDEDRGPDVTRWVKAYPEVATALNIATLVCDHSDKKTTDSGKPGEHPVGSRAKRAKAKVGYSIQRVKNTGKPGREHVAKIRVWLTKNTLGAAIEEERTFRIGGYKDEDGKQCFLIERDESFQAPDSIHVEDVTAAMKYKDKAVEKLREAYPESLSKSALADAVGGKRQEVMKAIEEMPAQEVGGERLYPVETVVEGARTRYRYVPEEEPKDGSTAGNVHGIRSKRGRSTKKPRVD